MENTMANAPKRTQQIEYSRSQITQALISFMNEKPFHEITISEVTKRADLSRRTFYRHFHSLEDVLELYIEELCNEFYSNHPFPGDTTFFSYDRVYYFFTFWKKHHLFLKSVKSSSISASIFRYISTVLFNKKVAMNPELLTKSDARFAQYIFIFLRSGLWNILLNWISEEDPATPEEMVILCKKIIEQLFTDITRNSPDVLSD